MSSPLSAVKFEDQEKSITRILATVMAAPKTMMRLSGSRTLSLVPKPARRVQTQRWLSNTSMRQAEEKYRQAPPDAMSEIRKAPRPRKFRFMNIF
jgi:hypothetical protein